jgi:hypothetical protein
MRVFFLFLAVGALACAQSESPESASKMTQRATTLHKKIVDWKFIGLTAGLSGSTTLDIESTYGALRRCGGNCYEANPAARFIYAGRPVSYGIYSGLTGTAALATYKLREKGFRWWWVPILVNAGIHSACAVHNFRVAR